MSIMLVKGVLVLCVLLNYNVNGQICKERTVVNKLTYETYTYKYVDKYSKKNWFGKVVYKTRVKTAIGSKPVEKQEIEFVPKCCDGYIRADSGSLDDIECTPICTPACENGRCISPGECECNEGYLVDFETPHKCLPSCDVCLHGTCVAHNVCRCDYGYSVQNGISCAPICSEPCVNSACVAPDTCQCNYGYRKSDTNVCVPYCSRGCIHGTCTEPETCTCNIGWHKSERGECVPKCDVTCGNGTCTEPNRCKCAEGYKVDQDHDPICIPHCDVNCGNGTCVAPDTCECEAGYKLDMSKDPLCVPKCEIECGHGACIAPNRCECDVGYRVDEDNPACVPQCDIKCGNGTCVAPNKCECKTGYKAETNREVICVPQCEIECGTGSCTAPNHCECKMGYKIDTDIIPRCVPQCNIMCGNGTCVAPNKCECNIGFALDLENNPACVPKCRYKCGNGTCIAPNVCKCFPGYKENKDREPNCVPDCGDCEGNCFKPDKCECTEPFNAIRFTADGKECEHDDKCIRTVCKTVTTVKANEDHVTYGYDDIDADDTSELRNITHVEKVTTDWYAYDDFIVNETIVRDNAVENQIQGSEYWVQSKWGYAVISIVAIIFAIILGSLVIFRKTIWDCCKGTHYDVGDERSKDASNAGQTSNGEIRMSTILKKREESSLSHV